MLVKDIMQSDVVIISPFASLRDAMKLMEQKAIKSLVVDRKDEHDAYGILTYTTILRTIVAEEGDIDLINVYDVCSKPAVSVYSAMDVKYVARMMVNHDFRRIIVLDNNRLVGIISMADIIAPVLRMAHE